MFFAKKQHNDDPFIIKEDNPKIRDKKLDHSYQDLYVANANVNLKPRKIQYTELNRLRINFFWLAVIFVFFVFVLRLSYLQIWRGDYFFAVAEGNRTKTIPIKAQRGIIYDQNNRILTRNIPNFSLEVNPHLLPAEKKAKLLSVLSEITVKNQKELKKILVDSDNSYVEPLELIPDLPYQQALKLKIALTNIPGTEVILRSNRNYLEGEYLSHLLGYLGKIGREEIDLVKSGQYQFNDFLGKAGLERQYESVLKGKDGYREIEINALGQEQNLISEVEPVQGKSLRLNIDAKVQEKLYNELENYTAKAGSKKAAAVVLNPNNGAVLALVSLPSYNNNYFSQNNTEELEKILNNNNQPLFFRPLQGEYPSGSTFKPIVASAALAEGIIDRNTTILSQGGLKVSRWFFPDWKAGGHGPTNVIKAIAESVNTFFYVIGGGYQNFKGLGVNRLTNYARRFHLTEKTGIDFTDESVGFLPSREWKEKVKKEKWYIGDTYNLSIGQGDILVTPLQMAVAYSAIINGGKIMTPQIVDGYLEEDSKNYQDIKPQEVAEVEISKQNLLLVKEGLGAAVKSGSARYLSTLNVSSGGKTGTAQVGGNKKPHAWFIGFAPYEEPEILVVVLIENGGEGSTYAVPVARNFYQWYFDEYKGKE